MVACWRLPVPRRTTNPKAAASCDQEPWLGANHSRPLIGSPFQAQLLSIIAPAAPCLADIPPSCIVQTPSRNIITARKRLSPNRYSAFLSTQTKILLKRNKRRSAPFFQCRSQGSPRGLEPIGAGRIRTWSFNVQLRDKPTRCQSRTATPKKKPPPCLPSQSTPTFPPRAVQRTRHLRHQCLQ